jgi:N4-(beta-N-acetylglucosaminyl)-L-asparaginase
MSRYTRRDFIRTGAGLGAAALLSRKPGTVLAGTGPEGPSSPAERFCVVSSGNGIRATEKAMEVMRSGGDPLDAVISGVNIVEDDPDDMSVGYGGLPNEDGVVELDASVMYGPTHTSGAVAALRDIKNPSRVAKLVMERTQHCLLVGEGALRFALAHGFKREDLLTEKAREAWLKWKPQSDGLVANLRSVVMTHGTINCLALDGRGALAGVTTTSGLSYKLAGRVGDSPIIGAGLYVDNAVGAAGSTGVGEANIRTCASYQVVSFMAAGLSPEQACLKTLETIAGKAKLWPRRLNMTDADDRPRFGLNFYALNKKGEFGAASMFQGGDYAVHDGTENKLRDSAYLFKRNK